jgi:hypothetical protein
MTVKKTTVRVGKVYEVTTFASVNVHMKIVSIDDLEKGFFFGQLVRQDDLLALISAGVPYKKDTPLEETIGFVYDFQIIRKVKKGAADGKIKKAKDAVGNSTHSERSDALESRPRRRRRRRVRGIKDPSNS